MRSGDRQFLLRVAPYVIGTGQAAGAVLTFTNVTAFRASLEQAIYEREYTKAILNTVTSPLVVLDSDLRVQSGNRAFYSMFGVSREKAQGVPLQNLGDHDWKTSDLWTALHAVVSRGSEFPTARNRPGFPGIGGERSCSRPAACRVKATRRLCSARRTSPSASERKRNSERRSPQGRVLGAARA